MQTRDLLRGMILGGIDELDRAVALDPAVAPATAAALSRLLKMAIDRMDRRGGVWSVRDAEAAALARLPGLRASLYNHGRLPTHEPLIDGSHLLRARLDPDDPDLPDLLWVAIVRGHREVSARLLALIEESDSPRLPGCPWPGRLLALDVERLVRVAARWRTAEAVLWSGAMVPASDRAFRALVDALGSQQIAPPPPRSWNSYELALVRVALSAAERLAALRGALGGGWDPIFLRVGVLADQLAEGDHGPLHPELARLRFIVTADRPM